MHARMHHISLRTITTVVAFTLSLVTNGAALAPQPLHAEGLNSTAALRKHHLRRHRIPRRPVFQPPAGYDGFAIFITNGEWDLATPNPDIPNCEFAGGACQTDYYFTEIAGMSQAEIDAEAAKAKAWFKRRFGIDVDNPANADRLDFFISTTDSRMNFRAYYLSGRNVPPEGYPIRDGAFSVMITDPNGFTLGGDFPGRHVAQNSFAVFGEYNVLITNPAGNPVDEEIFYFRSDTIIEPLSLTGPPDGIAAFSCQLSNIPYDEGVENNGFARIFVELNLTEDNIFQIASRHTLTIGGHGPRLF